MKRVAVKLPTTRQEVVESLRGYRAANPRPLSPCVDQTEEDIGAYYRQAEVGEKAVVRNTQYGVLRYTVTTIEGKNPARGRVYIQNAGAFYIRHGRNCFHPKGQITLVVPTQAVLAWAIEHPRGERGMATHRENELLKR
jgi:hypothetical protein